MVPKRKGVSPHKDKKWYQKHLQQKKNKLAELKLKGICSRCQLIAALPNQSSCQTCLDYKKNWTREVKKQCYDHYGRMCQCCKQTFEECFLNLDHVNNDGKIHRKLLKSNKHCIYSWVIKNKFPNILQTLCWNCNMAKSKNGGVCPHQEKIFVPQVSNIKYFNDGKVFFQTI